MDTADKILLAINSELDLIGELVKYYEAIPEKDQTFATISAQKRLITVGNSLRRIVNRVEQDVEYRLGVVDGKVQVTKD